MWLFGKDYQLTFKKELTQPGQFAAEEQVEISTPKSSFKLRILGPLRKQTQVELALSDALKLGLKLPVRDSGDLAASPGITVTGPKGRIELAEGVIAACRHIHMNPAEADAFKVADKQFVKVACTGERCLIFDRVLIRVHDSFQLEMHIDTDEANAAMLANGAQVELVK